ncbi:MAG TPA: hypothetical protein PLQ44_01485 [Candidatus Paceibacterota bacterium]|nr:hypothetical protein [Candidatus Paceibacterota bacterium]HPT40259.1 hypothetical protein [Candidatus Paceibacterota bacterium]
MEQILRNSWKRFLSGRTIAINDWDSLTALIHLFNHILKNKKIAIIIFKNKQPFLKNQNPLFLEITNFHSATSDSVMSIQNKLSAFNINIIERDENQKTPLVTIQKNIKEKIFATLTPMMIRIDYLLSDSTQESSTIFLFEN